MQLAVLLLHVVTALTSLFLSTCALIIAYLPIPHFLPFQTSLLTKASVEFTPSAPFPLPFFCKISRTTEYRQVSTAKLNKGMPAFPFLPFQSTKSAVFSPVKKVGTRLYPFFSPEKQIKKREREKERGRKRQRKA